MPNPPELSLTNEQAATVDALQAVVVEQGDDGLALAVAPDLAEWWVKGDGTRETKEKAKDLTLGDSLSTREQLRRPFTPAAVRWKVQTHLGAAAKPSGALIVPYIDARLVADRLDLVVPDDWEEGDPKRPELAPFQPVDWGGGYGAMLCRLTVAEVTHQDVGNGRDAKAMVSDAFKRAAVKHGIGRFLYAITKVKFGRDSGYLRFSAGKNKKGEPIERPWLTDAGEAWLPKLYTRWLWEHGVAAFGLPLDHGDSLAAVGDFEAVDSEELAGAEEEPEGPPTEQQKGRAEMRKAVTKKEGEK